jgi:lipopolysaccharide/colanic/teichoic acid biosynthesis glycosyltransferase
MGTGLVHKNNLRLDAPTEGCSVASLTDSGAPADVRMNLEQYFERILPERAWYEHAKEPWLRRATYRRIKRLMDLSISSAVLLVILPVLAVCALAIKLDSRGPIWFKQLRTGKGGRRFQMYKFRTMVSNAEELKAQYMHLNELSPPDFKITNDPRITRVGRFLRKASLDELPQLINILKGEMSLVGPRPTSFSASTYNLWHTARLAVKPGLTGLWQVSGRSELDFDDRLRLDIAYMRNQRLSLDLAVLARTFGSVLNGRGAN